MGTRYCSARCGEIALGARVAEPLPARRCALAECAREFLPRSAQQRCCSEPCGKKRWAQQAKADGRTYHEAWNDRRRDRYHRRRAQQRATSTGEPVLRERIAERDGWRCHLCGERVSKTKVWPDPMSASLDHVVPLSKGGAHTPANVRLAHVSCNVAKGDRAQGEQLLLIG